MERKLYSFHMSIFLKCNGHLLNYFITFLMSFRSFLSEVGIVPDEVRHLIPHQANGVMLQELVDAMQFCNLTQHLIVDQYANTGSASIPLTLDYVRRRNHIASGDLVLMAGFGGGMSVGLTLIRW